MLRKPSLKRHILALALSAILLVWLVTALLTWLDAKRELNDVLDAHLAQASTLLVAQASHELKEVETDHAPLLHKYSRRIAFQVWEHGRELRLHSVNAPDIPLSPQTEGFSDATVDGKHWRVFSSWDDSGTLLIHVAELTEVREALARGIAATMLRPIWVALPLLALLLWWAVSGGLKPLTRLTEDIAQRAPDNLAPLATTATPAEVTPVIERLNQLFARIGSTMDNERRFTADAAHELRTPIAAIKAQAQVALGAIEEPVRRHALDGAIAGCDRAAHLIEQLLTLARLDTIDHDTLQLIDLRTLAANCLAEIAPAALNRDIQLELAEGNSARIQGMPALISILLRNLIDNAVRHTPAGTTVSVDIVQSDAHANITITDNGAGLPPAELEKISQRFYRPLGTEASGSGLGLSIVRRIAELHHAQLSFSSDAEKSGLKVTVNFPLAVQ